MALDLTDRDELYETLHWLDIEDFWEWIYSLYSNIDFSRLSISEIIEELEFIKQQLYSKLKEEGIHYKYWKKLMLGFDQIYRLYGLSSDILPSNVDKQPKVTIDWFSYAIYLKVKSKMELDVALSTIILEVSNILES